MTDRTKNPIFLTDKETASRYRVSPSTVWRWVQAGAFPKPMKLGPGCTRWRVEDLKSFEASREACA